MDATHSILKKLLDLNDAQKNVILEALMKKDKNEGIRETLQQAEQKRIADRPKYIQRRKESGKQKLLAFIEEYNSTYAKHKNNKLFTYLRTLKSDLYDEVYTFLYYLVHRGSRHCYDPKNMSYSQDFTKDYTEVLKTAVHLLLPGAEFHVHHPDRLGHEKIYNYVVIWPVESDLPDYAKILICSNQSQGLNYDEVSYMFEFNEEEFEAIDYGKEYDRYFPKIE